MKENDPDRRRMMPVSWLALGRLLEKDTAFGRIHRRKMAVFTDRAVATDGKAIGIATLSKLSRDEADLEREAEQPIAVIESGAAALTLRTFGRPLRNFSADVEVGITDGVARCKATRLLTTISSDTAPEFHNHGARNDREYLSYCSVLRTPAEEVWSAVFRISLLKKMLAAAEGVTRSGAGLQDEVRLTINRPSIDEDGVTNTGPLQFDAVAAEPLEGWAQVVHFHGLLMPFTVPDTDGPRYNPLPADGSDD